MSGTVWPGTVVQQTVYGTASHRCSYGALSHFSSQTARKSMETLLKKYTKKSEESNQAGQQVMVIACGNGNSR